MLVFELTMGEQHVYFPDEKMWLNSVPDWARDKWNDYLDACTQWCSGNNIPLSVIDNGFVYEEKQPLNK